MGTELLVTVTGADRSGLVKRLAERTHAHEGRWLDSKMVHLDGLLAGIIKIDVPPERVAGLEAELRAMDGIQVAFAEPVEAPPVPTRKVEMTVEATDRPGIAGDITHLLADNGVVVEDMTCHCFGVPNLSETVFCGSFSLLAPVDLDRQALTEEVEALHGGDIRIALKDVDAD